MSAGDENRRRRSGRRPTEGAKPPRQAASLRRGRHGGPKTALSRRQLQVVETLQSAGVLSVSEVADALGVSRSAATTVVEDLVQLGVVDRRMDPEDRRRRQVRLTVAWLPRSARGSGAG